jgi:hypothetical protein
VATHGHCFDGLCSAVMFTRLMRHLRPGVALRFTYHASGYGPGQSGVDPKTLVGDVNAILDFRYSRAKELTWYFDHHVSAFPSPDDRADFEARAAGGTMFHDAAYSSCTKLIADVGRSRFGLDTAPAKEMIDWADVIDSAAFPSAKMAVERKEPELQLMTVVEHLGDDACITKLAGQLLDRPLSEVARAPEVGALYAPLGRQHESFVLLVKERAVERDAVVVVDLSDHTIEAAGKFVTYALFPESAYSVLLSRSKSKCKLSVGYNPWSPLPRRHNIAAICERYGGGGHPVVGAMSLPVDRIEEARGIMRTVAAELAS